MQISEAEKAWGHHVDEQVSRSLTPQDLRYLENFLTADRAKGSSPKPSSPLQPVKEFDLINFRMDKMGFKRADVDQKESYNADDKAEQDLIKTSLASRIRTTDTSL